MSAVSGRSRSRSRSPITPTWIAERWPDGELTALGSPHAASGCRWRRTGDPEGLALYGSSTTFFTLGLGDVLPHTRIGRVLVALEAGTWFAFLALIISYVPALYQQFSSREVNVSLLDVRAGSLPIAVKLLRRHADTDFATSTGQLLSAWKRWPAKLLESHQSYSLLAYYRAQHEHQSWVTALTMILDVCALTIVGMAATLQRPARIAFAMARHAAAGLSRTSGTTPRCHGHNRLSASELAELRAVRQDAGIPLREGADADAELARLGQMYEPFVRALADRLLMPLPHRRAAPGAKDAWKITAWGVQPWDVARDSVAPIPLPPLPGALSRRPGHQRAIELTEHPTW